MSSICGKNALLLLFVVILIIAISYYYFDSNCTSTSYKKHKKHKNTKMSMLNKQVEPLSSPLSTTSTTEKDGGIASAENVLKNFNLQQEIDNFLQKQNAFIQALQ